ncbi:hypothetical protein BXZ70DRAFT_744501 [Cristinia sonorae]|uniref:Uncharacterized protein n=1 Tax=Cristinia sonorae TaxID=1940300 RepID=A0A8K0XK24_9AGAR|nr:hypothetical protein BXZ70DRAFT_744501 [Cristinia sonorae]
MQRTVLITGCSNGGIGHELALQLHSKGMKVIATARKVSTMTELTAVGIETLELDVTSSESIQRLKTQVEKITGGTLDVLVNNAGVCYEATVSDDTVPSIKTLFDVNVFGLIGTTQAFIPLLIESNKRQLLASGSSSGTPFAFAARIVQIGSITAGMPMPFYSAYNASKAAVLQYGNTLRVELAPFGVKVITIHSGKVQTRFVRWGGATLPEDSVFSPVKDVYEGLGANVFTLRAVPLIPYVQELSGHIVKPNPRAFYWMGNSSGLARVFDLFFPRTLWDTLFGKLFQLKRLAVAFKTAAVNSARL